MIRGVLRLCILYLLVWAIGVYWDSGANFYRMSVEWVRVLLPLHSLSELFFSFLIVACGCHMAGFWLWIHTIELDPRKGPRRYPLPSQPVRYYFRLRPNRIFGAIILSLLSLLFALQSLKYLGYFQAPLGFFSYVYDLPFVIGVGRKITPWLVYGGLHSLAVGCGWVVLSTMTVKRTWSSVDGRGAFMRYQAVHNPVARVFTLVILLAHYPFAALTATTHSHPLHGLVVLCSLVAILLVAFIGQFITLQTERSHDKWLNSLIEKARKRGRWSSEYHLWETTITFLTGEKPDPLGSGGSSEPSPSMDKGKKQKKSNADPSQNSKEEVEQAVEKAKQAAIKIEKKKQKNRLKGERSLAVVKTLLQRGKNKRARKKLQKLVGHEDPRIAQHAEELLRSAPVGNQTPSKFFRFVKLSIAGCAGLFAILVVVTIFQYIVLPDPKETRQLACSAHLHVQKIKTEETEKVELFGNRYDYSLNTSLENISQDFQNGVIASEDHRFYEHGVVYKVVKFVQAGVMCTLTKLNPFAKNRACHGNSTLTQQLARNLFLSEERSITRKLSELLWAIKMETGLSKEEILDFYMNRIYLGKGNYGVEMAARDYFRKNASNLTTQEAAYLAAAIKRPNWNYHQDRENAQKRAELILALMKKHGYTEERIKLPDSFAPRLGYKNLHKPYFGHLWQWAKSELDPIMEDLPRGNYKVLTTLNAEVEIYAEKALQTEISRFRRRGKPVSQGAVVVMRPSGELLAMVGGVGIKGRYFNRAKRTAGLLPRPPASSFKPFVYLAGLEAGLKPTSLINAGPVSIPMAGAAPYQPTNHDGKVYGSVSLRDGLVYSINTAAVRLLYKYVGYDDLFGTVNRLGIEEESLGEQWGLALGQSGVPLIEMAGAYGVFANGGKQVEPYTVTAITNESGKTIWHRTQKRQKRVFKKEHISDINSMLRDVVRYGTGKRAVLGLPQNTIVAGKTGTGDDFVDAWFIGYTSDLVIAVWMGNDKPKTMDGLYGGTGPARVFNNILRKLTSYTDITSATGILP